MADNNETVEVDRELFRQLTELADAQLANAEAEGAQKYVAKKDEYIIEAREILEGSE